MTEANETDLLPWILGSSFIVASVIAIVIASSARTISNPVAVAPRYAAGKADVKAAARPAIAVQTPSQPALAPGQVWQCVVNGQPTFSDSPCSNTALVRQLSQMNRMEAVVIPAPVTSYHSTTPEYTPGPLDPSTADADNDSSFCDGLKAEVSSIIERMRRGYYASEGENLRARLRQISDIQYERSCLR